MSFIINSECSGCGICADVCPYDAIEFKRNGASYGQAAINPEKCYMCGKCREECPKEAIKEG